MKHNFRQIIVDEDSKGRLRAVLGLDGKGKIWKWIQSKQYWKELKDQKDISPIKNKNAKQGNKI
jgi:hypothetical protein